MGNSITWPFVATVLIIAVVIVTLALTGHADIITIATGALAATAVAIAHAFIARNERARIVKKLAAILERGEPKSGQAVEQVSEAPEK